MSILAELHYLSLHQMICFHMQRVTEVPLHIILTAHIEHARQLLAENCLVTPPSQFTIHIQFPMAKSLGHALTAQCLMCQWRSQFTIHIHFPKTRSHIPALTARYLMCQWRTHSTGRAMKILLFVDALHNKPGLSVVMSRIRVLLLVALFVVPFHLHCLLDSACSEVFIQHLMTRCMLHVTVVLHIQYYLHHPLLPLPLHLHPHHHFQQETKYP